MSGEEVTWEVLIGLEPGLALLEHETLKIQDWPERPYFCANAYWYGRGGVKDALSLLVGWGRRDVEIRTDLHEGEEKAFHGVSLLELSVKNAGYDEIHRKIQQQEEAVGLGVLWTSEAYSTAYQHLYGLLPDCRHEGLCHG